MNGTGAYKQRLDFRPLLVFATLLEHPTQFCQLLLSLFAVSYSGLHSILARSFWALPPQRAVNYLTSFDFQLFTFVLASILQHSNLSNCRPIKALMEWYSSSSLTGHAVYKLNAFGLAPSNHNTHYHLPSAFNRWIHQWRQTKKQQRPDTHPT